MRPQCQLFVKGGTTHLINKPDLDAVQALVSDQGQALYPLFLRMGSAHVTRLQPVTARALLAEVEQFSPKLANRFVPGVSFRNEQGEEIGRMYGHGGTHKLIEQDRMALAATLDGIRLVLGQFPPPAGFRSHPGLEPMQFECYFEEITRRDGAFYGRRTPAMGGTGAPVPLPDVPLPSVTRWDNAKVAGKPAVASLVWIRESPLEVYKDVIHAFVSCCDESLRMRMPLEFRLL